MKENKYSELATYAFNKKKRHIDLTPTKQEEASQPFLCTTFLPESGQ